MKYLVILALILSTHLAAESSISGEAIQEMTVAAPRIKNSVEALLEVRKQKNDVSDVLGQEAMSRSGDSDAAASLRRVTGLTLVNGKFVYVRGLGERYSSVLLNGSQVPSPEPTRRVVPLDLFPVAILESITVQKSFSPDRPAEFGGGLIELQTRNIPSKFTGQMTLGANTDNFQSGLSYLGGKQDHLGFDDGTRKMPSIIRNAFRSKKKIIVSETEGFKMEEIVKMTKSLSNTYNVKESSGEVLPNIQFSLGDSKKIAQGKIGGLMGFIYSNGADVGERQANSYNVGAGQKLEKDDKSNVTYAEREVQLGGALDLGFDYRDSHQFKLTSILLRNSTNLTQEKITEKSSDSFSSRKYTLMEWTERQLFLNQISGAHRSDTVDAKWRFNKSIANRDSPDSREIMRNNDGSQYVLETDVAGNKRVFSQLEDQSQEIGADLDLKLYERGDRKFLLKFGGAQNTKKRISDVYRLHLKNNFAPGSVPDLSQDTETILGQRGSDAFLLTNITDSADSFTGDQQLMSYYTAVEMSPSEKWTMVVGARKERSLQEVKTFKYYEPDMPTSEGSLKMDDVLPSYNVTWKVTKDERFRLAYGETVARPDFRELSTVSYIEDETGYDVIGNSHLKGTVIKNWDLRYERYFADSDYYSLGFFYKDFQAPIEAVFEPGDKLVKTFMNAETATNYGAEVEGRYSLRNIARTFRRWSVASNVSVINSIVTIDASQGNQTSKERPLQGQSPYVANIQLLYDRPQYKISSGLVYNVVGKRITEVGTNARPDVYEQPVHQLDFIFNQKFGDWGYGLRARNLLNPVAISSQGGEVVRSRQRGRSYVFNLSAYF
ncbi:MAG: TonB-dependent receptor [Bacteriovoracaceae bacterium]|nr:TonB-dependent receptor [Bacteriovoracaceae bacterium]